MGLALAGAAVYFYMKQRDKSVPTPEDSAQTANGSKASTTSVQEETADNNPFQPVRVAFRGFFTPGMGNGPFSKL